MLADTKSDLRLLIKARAYKCAREKKKYWAIIVTIPSLPVRSLDTSGIGSPLSFCSSSPLPPDREKVRNKLGARVMIDDTPPLVHTSLLTHCCFSALIGQPCKLSSQCMRSPVLSKPPTQRIVWTVLLWLSTDHKPDCTSAACCCRWYRLYGTHLRETKYGRHVPCCWQKMSISVGK